jgi:integrase
MSVPTPIAWPEFRDELLALYTASRAPKTAQRMRQVLALVEREIAPRTTADLTPGAVAAFSTALEASGRAPNTRAALLSYLRRACSYAALRASSPSPFSLWPGLVKWVPPRSPRVHTAETIATVLDRLAARSIESIVDGRLHAWASVLAHTGLRRDEGLFLRVEDVDLKTGTLHVRRRLKRPTARRTVAIPPPLRPTLAAWLDRREGEWVFPNRNGKPWHGGAVGYRPSDRLIQAGEAAGVKGFSPSSLRHSFASLCATSWGVAPATLQRMMGHTDIRTTMRYYVHLDMEVLIRAARTIGFPPAA